MLYLAATLLFLLGLAHSYLGERYILMRLFRQRNLPKLFGGASFTARTLRFAWHITTVAWWGFAALLILLEQNRLNQASVLSIIGWTMLLSGLLPLVVTRGRHLSWLVFFVVGVVALYAASG